MVSRKRCRTETSIGYYVSFVIKPLVIRHRKDASQEIAPIIKHLPVEAYIFKFILI